MRKSLPLALLLCTLFFATSASATYADFTDVTDHWAGAILEQAYDDGILKGFEDGTLRPDEAVHQSELVVLLMRMIDAQENGSVPGIPGDAWYSDAARKAAYIGLIEDGFGMNNTLTRLEAFRLIADAFQIQGSHYQNGDLSKFTDLAGLTDADKAVLFRLHDRGYLQGHSGLLEPKNSLTRAELVTILYRIIPNRLEADFTEQPASGGIIVGGEKKLTLKDQSFTNPLWLDCTTTGLELDHTSAGTITILSHKLSSLTLKNESSIEMLILSGGDGTAMEISASGSQRIGTLVIGDFKGAVTVGSGVEHLVIAGNRLNVTLTGSSTKTVTILGSGSSLSAAQAGSVDTLTIASYANQNTVTLAHDLATLYLDGIANVLNLQNVAIARGEFRGEGNSLTGSGSVAGGALYALKSFTSAETVIVGELEDRTDLGIDGIQITATWSPTAVPLSQALALSATVVNPRARDCTATFLLDEEIIHEQALSVGPEAVTVIHTVPITYSPDMKTDRSFRFVLSYTSLDGETKQAEATVDILLEYTGVSHEEALARVTSTYIGNYTTAWAEANDYDEGTKTAWINAKGYSSNTDYIIWINRTYQRVNIFSGSQGNWTLLHSYLCGTGRDGHSTPVGLYTVTNRSARGWTTSTYNVRPVVNFTNSRYSEMAFHSRKYDPSHSRLTDGSIGFPVSLGCIRMYDEEVQWIYDNIPNGTPVVVH